MVQLHGVVGATNRRMRYALLVATFVTCTASVADAGHVEDVLRTGCSWMSATGGNYGPDASGAGVYLDNEVAWRSEHLSVGMFAALYTLRAATYVDDQDTMTSADARYVFGNLGGRVTVHSAARAGVYAGIGIADEAIYESGRRTQCVCANELCNPCGGGYANETYTRWTQGPLFELHAGGTLPRTGPVAIDVMALVGADLAAEHGWIITTERLAIGARF